MYDKNTCNMRHKLIDFFCDVQVYKIISDSYWITYIEKRYLKFGVLRMTTPSSMAASRFKYNT